jgi:diketogulonate reductase-like aldo/keto reductase
MENYQLNNGVLMPKVGLGVYNIKGDSTEAVVWALKQGYRHLDTAAIYHNEELIAEAVRKSGVKRSELFITTKVWTSDLGAKTRVAFESSLQKLNTDYVDLYLIHWPTGDYLKSWSIMEDLYRAGKIRAIGVSNFEQPHLEKVMKHGTIIPAVNQVQTHPFLQKAELHNYMMSQGIQHVAWAPFGRGNKRLLTHPVLNEIGSKKGKTAAQVILRWNLQRDIAVIPKSITPARLEQNIDIFDFTLSDQEMRDIAVLDLNQKGFIDSSNKLYLWFTRWIR